MHLYNLKKTHSKISTCLFSVGEETRFSVVYISKLVWNALTKQKQLLLKLITFKSCNIK